MVALLLIPVPGGRLAFLFTLNWIKPRLAIALAALLGKRRGLNVQLKMPLPEMLKLE